MDSLTLSVEVLDWAADKAGETREGLANLISKRSSDRDRIMQGQVTVSQAVKVAKRARIPFGFLFLKSPPKLEAPHIPDLRQSPDAVPLGPDFFELFEDIKNKQDWFVEYLLDAGAADLPFVGRFDAKDKPSSESIAKDIRETLNLSDDDRAKSQTADAFFSLLSEKAESAGVVVMKSGIVKANTRRPLSPREFRGFALADVIAPVVFINGRDAQVASVFTLFHELAHIWLGATGVSDVSAPPAFQKGLERLCNQVAADVLVPKQQFLEHWARTQDIDSLARYFRVSRLVVARRAFDLNKIDQDAYDAIASARYRSKPGGGGDGLKNIRSRNSKRVTRAIVASAMSGELLLREAAALLNSKPDTIVSLWRKGQFNV